MFVFVGKVCSVNRWQALTDIAKAFIDGGRPGYAFATVCVVGAAPFVVGAGAILLKLF